MVQSHHHKVGREEGALSFPLLFPSSCFPPFPSQRSNPSSTASDSMYLCSRASQMVLVVKNPPANVGDIRDSGFNPWVGKISWRRAWQPTSVFLLENPKDRGAWWATVHGVAKNRIQLKRLITQASTLCSQVVTMEPFQSPLSLQVWSDIQGQPRSLQKYIKGRI